MFDVNQWIMNRIKRFTEGFSYTWQHTRHHGITWHNDVEAKSLINFKDNKPLWLKN